MDETPRAGTSDDPHRSLTGALASLWRKYTTIKLLGEVHNLGSFPLIAFPDVATGPSVISPFEGLNGRPIEKVKIEPEYCSNSPSTTHCIQGDN